MIYLQVIRINILKAIELLNNEKGVILIVKNYTRDVINYTLCS
jgi:dihydroxyacetone kinase